MDLVPGAEVERYVIISRIGAGRMSTTYGVRHRTLDTLHALQVPNSSHRGFLKRLVAGAKLQARLRHPNIISATDVLDLDGGLPGIVLDHVEGPNLGLFVSSNDLDEDAIDALAAGMFDAVGFVHSNSIVHRHLKPKNIIVDVGGEVVVPRITDFTLARVMGGTVALRKGKKPRVFGTAGYMSPEQTYNSDLVGPRSDLWSLGCMLYYLCTGVEPFTGEGTEAVFKAVRQARYRPLRRVLRQAPPRWSQAIADALILEEDDRVPTVTELAECWFEGTDARPRMFAKAAPVGRVTLVFTDIEGSTRLWENNEEVARHSLHAHDAVMRAALHRHGGYEVKTEGDAFMVAFATPVRAIQFCLEVQRLLYEHPWGPELLEQPEASEAPGFRGLRVRMGVHVGEPEARSRGTKVDYYGPMVNRAARIAGAGHGGQILVSGQAWDEARRRIKDADVRDLGPFRLRGLADAQPMIQLLPQQFAQRRFPAVKAKPVTLPG